MPEHSVEDDDWQALGDVKYHLGTGSTRQYADGRVLHLSLLANPSHLEAVNPLVVGKARAKMVASNDDAGRATLPILLHGDAAMAGQGVVYETMQMSQLADYQTGGTIHIIANNQVVSIIDRPFALSSPRPFALTLHPPHHY